MIKVKWTSQILHIENIRNLTDLIKKRGSNFEINDLTTFEMPQTNIESTPLVSPAVTKDIESICLNIVRHIQDVSNGNTQIFQMDLFFKLDNENRIWLLFSTGIKVKKGMNDKVKHMSVRTKSPKFRAIRSPDCDDQEEILDSLRLNYGFMRQDKQKDSIKSRTQTNFCSRCLKEENDLYTLGMKHLLKWKDGDVEDKELNEILVRLWGDKLDKKIGILKSDKTWLELESNYCLNCFMIISEKYFFLLNFFQIFFD